MRTGKVILKKGHMNRHPKGVRTLAMWLCGLVGGGGGRGEHSGRGTSLCKDPEAGKAHVAEVR